MKIIFVLIFFGLSFHSFGQIKLPSIFSDNMVLQQNSKAVVWGWGDPGSEVRVSGSWSKDTVKTMVSNQADWKVKLKTPAAGGPFKISIKGSDEVVLKNVMITASSFSYDKITATSISIQRDSLTDHPHTYSGNYLTGIDFPIGPIGGSVIRMNGKAERNWWHIFNNYEERPGSGVVPNSFFAIRTSAGRSNIVRALQTSPIGLFSAMSGLSFQGEYPFGWYNFSDKSLPVNVKMEAYNPLIPMDLKNSSIPCAIFRITVKNTSHTNIKVSLLSSQQNAVGFNGYGTIEGIDERNFSGYGNNSNCIVSDSTSTSLKMKGVGGSMQLTSYETAMSYSASWNTLETLYNDFLNDGVITGSTNASSPSKGTTIDGVLSKTFTLRPDQERIVTFVLSWYFPDGTFGLKSIPQWYFPNGGEYYQNWWTDANDVDCYVKSNFNLLDSITRLYHNTMYSSNIPRYILDRITSNISVLKSPTAFWTKNGYFGLWESTSSKEGWFGNCKHVYHYAQGHARLFPELGRILRRQDLNTQLGNGLLPSRDGQALNAMDGHFGTILGIYREHLLTNENNWLSSVWERTKKAMDYAISTYDSNQDGMLSDVSYHNTLDCNVSGTSPWIGSLYLAALKASELMANIMGDSVSKKRYYNIFSKGVLNQDSQLWYDSLGYYKEKPANLANTLIMGDAVSIDMLLGQWWANQLDIGQIYPRDRTTTSLLKIYNTNRYTDSGSGYAPSFRDFLGTGDTGWEMFKFPGFIPSNVILYYDEVMSGFEYAAAATMLQYGMLTEGLTMINEISKRYDGRFRAKGEVHMAENSTVFGCGSPFGEDECGDFYGRALSSWSVLLALQGFVYDGPNQTIGFKPTWRPDDHASFFSAAEGWGLYTQTRKSSNQLSKIDVKYGNIKIKKILLKVSESARCTNISIERDGASLSLDSYNLSGDILTVMLSNIYIIKAGSNLTITFDL
ncbi:MAG: GH116 family glycosyl-hydrolase [Bacteroidota bacterium]|nr:GH116 family glycosyl-hydrolase [Bacteroidota bacterium]